MEGLTAAGHYNRIKYELHNRIDKDVNKIITSLSADHQSAIASKCDSIKKLMDESRNSLMEVLGGKKFNDIFAMVEGIEKNPMSQMERSITGIKQNVLDISKAFHNLIFESSEVLEDQKSEELKKFLSKISSEYGVSLPQDPDTTKYRSKAIEYLAHTLDSMVTSRAKEILSCVDSKLEEVHDELRKAMEDAAILARHSMPKTNLWYYAKWAVIFTLVFVLIIAIFAIIFDIRALHWRHRIQTEYNPINPNYMVQ